MEKLTLSFDIIGGNFIAAGEASSATKAALRKIGLSNDIIRRVSICMYEGEINQVIHGGGGKAVIEVDERRVAITLTDGGPGIPDVSKALEEGFSTATNEIREQGFGAGMGLPNMKRYSDEFEIISKPGEGTTVVMSIRF
ncbi:MAG: ATP-binding protein [Oscillospiraceae bacterium]|nr:ATP-binding protein [Oscillospiraceae bacterium]